ncbi:MAG: FliI/YscN family ATPase [Planctomycetota bacterium]|nr:FliI/YscN family ATPase [Planctomycetota bacterium]
MTTIDWDRYRRRIEQTEPLACRGRIVRVTGMTVESQGPPVGTGRLCDIHLADGRRIGAEVVGFHHEHRVLLPLEPVDGIAPDDAVVSRSRPRTIRLGPDVLGRILDGLGRPIDGRGPLAGPEARPVDGTSPPPLSRRPITEPLPLGIRVFDGVLTCGKGQRVGIFSGSGVGKSTLLGEIARVSDADVNVLALVGERGREVRQFLEQSLGPEGLARSVVVVATSDAAPIQRVKAASLAIAVAEYFRDQGKDVLFMMDSITRLAQAQREIGLAAGEPPTTKGYCPSVFSLLPRLTERLGSAEVGSITGIITVLVEADDMNDPVADCMRSLLDGHVVLARRLAELGHYPAVDILQSISRLMDACTTRAHYQAAQKLRAIYTTYQGAEDLINIGAFKSGSNPRIDSAVGLIDRINAFLIQPLGTRSTLEETVRRLVEITQSWDYLMPSDEETGQPAAATGSDAP